MLDQASRTVQFPTLSEMTYLNTAAEGIPPLSVGAAFQTYLADKQQGAAGRPAHHTHFEAVKVNAAALFGLQADEIGICSNSSEAFNLAALALTLREGDEVVVNDLDFPSGRTPWLLPRSPAVVRVWRSQHGALHLEDLRELLNRNTRLVTTSLVSYFNGYTVHAPSAAELVFKHSPALFAVDVTQALGRIPLQVDGADLIVSSTHKWILGPHGGGLIGIPRARFGNWTAPIGGWFNLEDPFAWEATDRPALVKPGPESFSAGMPNYPAIYGIRAALDHILAVGVGPIQAYAQPLVIHLLNELQSLPVEVLTPTSPDHLAGIVAFRHPDMPRLHAELAARGIQVMHSSGRIRVSIHGYNTPDDVETLLTALRELA